MMEIKMLKKEKKEIEFELGADQDTTLAEILVFKLNQNSDVEFAAYKIDHPLLNGPKIILKTKKGDPVKVIEKAIDELKKEIADFRAQISKMKV